MARWILVSFVAISLCLNFVSSEEDILEYETLQPHYELDEECLQQTEPTDEDIENIRGLSSPVSRNGRCLLACMYKKINIITDDGHYSPEANMLAAARSLALHPRAMRRAAKMVEQCTAIVEKIDDDEEGCEVAAALFECLSVNEKQFATSESSEDNDDEP